MIDDTLKLVDAVVWEKRGRALVVEKVGDITVSTVHTADQGPETAVFTETSEVVVVERYPSEEGALTGHRKWCEKALNGERTFTDINYGAIPGRGEVAL